MFVLVETNGRECFYYEEVCYILRIKGKRKSHIKYMMLKSMNYIIVIILIIINNNNITVRMDYKS